MKNKERDIVCLTGLFPEEYVDEINKYSLTGVQNAANKYISDGIRLVPGYWQNDGMSGISIHGL